MNAIASAGPRDTSIGRDSVAEYEGAGHVTDRDIANRHIRHLASWANVLGTERLILGSQQNRGAGLGEATPGVFEDVRFEQDPLSILKFKVVLHNEGIAVGPSDIPRLTFHPDDGLEHVIAPNLDVGRGHRGGTASKENAFARGLEEVIDNLEGSCGLVAATSCDRLGICARPRNRYAMEIGEVGIDHPNIGYATEHEATLGFILCCSVNPVAVEDHVVCYAAFVAHHHVINYARAGGPSELETDEAIVASSVGQDERPAVPC